MAECLSLLEGLRFAQQKGLVFFVVEIDAKLVIDAIYHDRPQAPKRLIIRISGSYYMMFTRPIFFMH